VPEDFRLYDNFPNPFNPETTIRFEIPEAADVNVEVYDILGTRVSTLVQQRLNAGSYAVRWNGGTNTGARAASGVYLCRMEASGYRAVVKMLLMK
jgi:flagellar hook assembly protein FlgD